MKSTMVLLAIAVVTGCTGIQSTSRIPAKAFYFWKSRLSLSGSELLALESLNVKQLYIKLFDVAFDPATGSPLPAAKFQQIRQQLLRSGKIL